jgi:hypothetical protein
MIVCLDCSSCEHPNTIAPCPDTGARGNLEKILMLARDEPVVLQGGSAEGGDASALGRARRLGLRSRWTDRSFGAAYSL